MINDLNFKSKLKIIQSIISAILKENNNILFVDGSNEIAIGHFDNLIEELDMKDEIVYEIHNETLRFDNGSIIEIQHPQNNIRGKRSKYIQFYDPMEDCNISKEVFDEILLKYKR